MTIEEPSYMMFARANVREGLSSSPAVVKALLARIDNAEAEEARKTERLAEHRRLAAQPIEDRDGADSAAMYAKERKA